MDRLAISHDSHVTKTSNEDITRNFPCVQSAIDVAKQHPDAKREEFMRLFDQHRGRRTRIAQVDT